MTRFSAFAARASNALPNALAASHKGGVPDAFAALAEPAARSPPSSLLTFGLTMLALLATALIYEQVNYQRKKAGLPGPKWTIPVIGKFADSLNPSLEKYMEGWNSGPLSVASVFHM